MWVTSNPAWRRAARGYTLIELLVVLAIVAALLVIAVPRLGAGNEVLTGQRQAREIGAQLSRSRSAAIVGQRQIAVVLTRGTVSGASAQPYELAPQWQLQHPDGQAIEPAAAMTIRFFPDGSSSGGALRLSDGQRSFALEVEWLTGRVSINASAPAG